MQKLKEVLRWFYDAFWPIWSLLIIYVFHQITLLPCNDLGFICKTEAEINKYYASVIQLVGGLIILFNIDSNLGLFSQTNIFSHSLAIIKKFPLFRSLATVNKASKVSLEIKGDIDARGYKKPETTEEYLEVLQKQITWLKDDFKDQKRVFHEKLQSLENILSSEMASVKTKAESLETKIINSAIGSLKPQIFGFILICYGAWLNIA